MSDNCSLVEPRHLNTMASTFFIVGLSIGRQTSRTNTNRGPPQRHSTHDINPSVEFIESLRHDDGWGLKILQPGGWCQTTAREDSTRSRQYQKIPSRARASSPTAFPGHLEASKQRPAPSFLFSTKSVNRQEKIFSPTNESETLVI